MILTKKISSFISSNQIITNSEGSGDYDNMEHIKLHNVQTSIILS